MLDVDFGAFIPGSIQGSVALDLNGSGTRESGEPGLAGVTVTLDAALDQYDATAITDANGHYAFSGLPAGNYTVSHQPPASCEPIGDPLQSVALAHAAVANVDLLDRMLPAVSGKVSGYCWYDINASGSWETPGEPGLNGRTVFLDTNGNGQFDAGEPWAVSGNDSLGNPGYYQFSSLTPGPYTVGIVPLDGWTETSPASHEYSVDLAAGSASTGLDFGASLESPNLILVSTLNDVDNGDFSFGDLSLREALRIADERGGNDSIRFAPSLAGRTIQIDPALGPS